MIENARFVNVKLLTRKLGKMLKKLKKSSTTQSIYIKRNVL